MSERTVEARSAIANGIRVPMYRRTESDAIDTMFEKPEQDLPRAAADRERSGSVRQRSGIIACASRDPGSGAGSCRVRATAACASTRTQAKTAANFRPQKTSHWRARFADPGGTTPPARPRPGSPPPQVRNRPTSIRPCGRRRPLRMPPAGGGHLLAENSHAPILKRLPGSCCSLSARRRFMVSCGNTPSISASVTGMALLRYVVT